MRHHLIVAYWDWHAPYISAKYPGLIYCNRNKIVFPDGQTKIFNKFLFDFMPRFLNRIGLNFIVRLIYELHGFLVIRALKKSKIPISSAHIWVGFSLYLINFLKKYYDIMLILERSGSWPMYQRDMVYEEKKYHRLSLLPSQDRLSLKRISQMEEEFKQADKILLCSNLCKLTFPNHFASKCEVISLGSNFSFTQNCFSTKRESDILMVSGASLRKGLHYIKDFHGLKSTLVMTPSLMRRQLMKLWFKHDVSFLKTMPRENLISHYRGHKWFLFPSIEDGFGMVVLEAISQGCIPFVSKYSGVSELFLSDLPELVFDPKSELDIDRIFHLMKDDDFYHLIVKRCESFSVDNWKKYVAKYKYMLKN